MLVKENNLKKDSVFVQVFMRTFTNDYQQKLINPKEFLALWDL